MKVFLTGGTGFIGQPLTRELLDRGWAVTALARDPDGRQAHRSSEQMWARTIDGEIKLFAKRAKRDLASRLRPVDE